MPNGTTMARVKKARGGPGPDDMETCALRMRHEYAQWLEEMASSDSRTVASMIEWALAKAAERLGHRAPPDRIPKRGA